MRGLVVLALLLGIAAPAQAAKVEHGSDLSQRPTLTEAHPRDWAAWPLATAPAAGEVSAVSVRGTIVAPRGLPNGFVFRVLVLRPQADGTLKLLVASTDLAGRLVNLDPAAVTTIDMQQFPERMCVLGGDVVAIATSGGYDPQTYPKGVGVQMFARVPGAGYGVFKEPEGTGSLQVGDAVTPARTDDAEALLRVTVGTGDDARPTCRVAGPPAPSPSPSPSSPPTPVPPGAGPVELSLPASTRIRRNRVKLAVSCPGAVACTGRVALSRKSKAYGSAAFELAAGETKRVRVRLNRAARRAIKRAGGKLTVKASATAGGETVTDRTVLRR